MYGRIVEITEASIASPIFLITDAFDQGFLSSGKCRDMTVTESGTLTADFNYHDKVYNAISGTLLSRGDKVACIEMIDKDGNKRLIAFHKL